MPKNERKELLIVFTIVGLCLIAGLLSTVSQSDIPVVSGNSKALDTADFIIKIGDEKLEVGSSPWSDAEDIFSGGQTLGMSTVYSTAPDDYLLTFTEKDNILCKADIYTAAISTYRDVKTGMTFEQVKKAYGKDFLQVSKKNNAQEFDMVYGTDDNCLIFNINDQKVWRIVVQRERK